MRSQSNVIKILGYIPGINVIAGVLAILAAENSPEFRPHNKKFWVCRGVAMIFTGPLLAIVDLVKFIFDSKMVVKYEDEKSELIAQFNTDHEHTRAYWAGHPIRCLKN